MLEGLDEADPSDIEDHLVVDDIPTPSMGSKEIAKPKDWFAKNSDVREEVPIDSGKPKVEVMNATEPSRATMGAQKEQRFYRSSQGYK